MQAERISLSVEKMAAGNAGLGDPDGFGFPGIPGLDGEGYEDSHEGFGEVTIPDIYQRITVHHEGDYIHELDAEQDVESDPEADYDLTAPPLES